MTTTDIEQSLCMENKCIFFHRGNETLLWDKSPRCNLVETQKEHIRPWHPKTQGFAPMSSVRSTTGLALRFCMIPRAWTCSPGALSHGGWDSELQTIPARDKQSRLGKAQIHYDVHQLAWIGRHHQYAIQLLLPLHSILQSGTWNPPGRAKGKTLTVHDSDKGKARHIFWSARKSTQNTIPTFKPIWIFLLV